MTFDDKIAIVRDEIKKLKLDAWIINGTDPHFSEYVSPCFEEIKWISGFTGSNATVVITKNNALIWVDSRYFIQCSQEIIGTSFEMMKLDGPDSVDITKWLLDNVGCAKIGVACELISVSEFRRFSDKGLNIVSRENIIDCVWEDRPRLPCTDTWKISDYIAGESSKNKIKRIREAAKKDGAQYVFVSSLDDIAWILNLRAMDLSCTPVFYSYLLIGPDKVTLFTDINHFKKLDTEHPDFEIEEYEKIYSAIEKVDGMIQLNPKNVNMKLYSGLKAETVEKREYSADFKAVKNNREVENIRQAVFEDCQCVVNLLGWIDKNIGKISELDVAEKLEKIRHLRDSYLCPSFETIVAFKEHGAIVHYTANEKTNIMIQGNGLLLIDCGGQYKSGTTDMTRTLLIGKATREQKEDYTAVLKGHLALGNAVFPAGTTGHQTDILAHQFLWRRRQDYLHGTGHGIGFILSVHEGPQRISSKYANVPLKEGMILSNEPGLYKEGRHGIRIENMVVVQDAGKSEFGNFLRYSNITLCPYDSRLVASYMLTSDEKKIFNSYQKYMRDIYKNILPKEYRFFIKKLTKRV